MRKTFFRTLIAIEIIAVLGSYRVWHYMNTDQNYRKWMRESHPSVLKGFITKMVEEEKLQCIQLEDEQVESKVKKGKEEINFAVPSCPVNIQEKTNKTSSETNYDNIIKNENIESKVKDSEIPYNQPSWGGTPDSSKKYFLTVLKDGTIKNNIPLADKALLSFGRLDECDVTIDHPSCSRYHAVVQYCVVEKDIRKLGYYLFDLGSTHGTYLNKEKLKPKVYTRIRVGYQIKFGGSSRLYIVEGPSEDQEEEIDLDALREKKRQYLAQSEGNKQKVKLKTSNSTEQPFPAETEGASWGFGEDAVEEQLDLKELFEKKKNVEVKDAKKTLRNFFEKEGLEFDYEMSERGSSSSIVHVAKVRLPIETSDSHEVIAEASSSNKKDAVLACATEACRLIQAYDLMQNRCKENQHVKRRRELEANDFYDSDDDNFLDRTGSVEKKRQKRKKWAGKDEPAKTAETYDTLKSELNNKETLLHSLEDRLALANAAEKDEADSLDDYMTSMQDRLDKTSKLKLRREIATLKQEIEKLLKLVRKLKPALPSIKIINNEIAIQSTRVVVDNNQSESDVDMVGIQSQHVSTEISKQFIEEPLVAKNESKSVDLKQTTNVKPNVDPLNHKPAVKKKKRVYSAQKKPKDNFKNEEKKEEEISSWMPPSDQTGDGRTHLNDKLGY